MELTGVDEMVLSLSAKGLTHGEISAHLADVCGARVSKQTISTITDQVAAEITGARVPAEFGDDPTRYASAKARKHYAGTSPVTRASGKIHTVQARFVRNNRLADALQRQAFCSLQRSPGARRHYDKQRARALDDNPALHQLGNRLVGILHGCLKTRTHYDEPTAWSHHATLPATA